VKVTLVNYISQDNYILTPELIILSMAGHFVAQLIPEKPWYTLNLEVFSTLRLEVRMD